VTVHIDAHQHFWKYDPGEYAWIDDTMEPLRRNFLPPDVEPEMARAGFQGCVAVQARQTPEETEWLLQLAGPSRFVRGVVGWVDLQSPDLASQLERFAAHPRFVGVRHIVQGEPDDRFLLRPAFLGGIERLAAYDLAYDILIYPRHLPVAAEFVAQFPGQRFVLDHLAKPDIRAGEIRDWARDLGRLAAFPNVSAKLSGLVTEAHWGAWTPERLRPYLDVAFECFGPSRLMIGSDWPVCTLAGDYGRVMRVVTDFMASRPAAEREAVLGGNAIRFWRLDRRQPRDRQEHER
jgi:L-fuconolactonase